MLELQKTLHNYGRYGQTLFALSGLDIALWDIAAKAAGVPLHRLFGMSTPADVPAYASLLRYGDPATVRSQCAAAVAQGYRDIKLHERTVPAVAAAREGAGPDARIMIDVNCPWTVQEASAMSEAFAPYDILWLEEPVWPPENYAGMAQVRYGGPLAIAAGENACTVWDFEKMLAAGAVTYAQPSVTKVGGITEFRKIMALCEANNVLLAPHSPYFGPGFLATIHLLVGTEQPVERYFGDLEADLFGGATLTRNGRLAVPDVPGIGPDPDPAIIARYRVDA
jgi:L-alanine-DL-glutamate epimerase-like enolase superfamily enzyme